MAVAADVCSPGLVVTNSRGGAGADASGVGIGPVAERNGVLLAPGRIAQTAPQRFVTVIWQFTQIWNDFLFGVAFTIGPSGRVVSQSITRSSGNPMLDSAARTTLSAIHTPPPRTGWSVSIVKSP